MKKIANFTVISTPDKVIVNRGKTFKHWFDILTAAALGLFFSSVTYFFLMETFEIKSFKSIASTFVMTLLTLYQLTMSISLLIQPAKNILIIDKKANRLLLKRTVFSTKSFPMDGIRNFEINKHKEKVYSGGSAWRSLVYCTIGTTIDRKDEVLLTVSSSRIFTVSDQKLEKELYELSKMISDEIYKRWKSKR
ncbi:hypothetical protein [Chryseobacterium sp. Mn2064]|uniref:hypothetical protein n=1 Tax=Chryseobacterium sp. Mn2064 TaxID=3395263 RepID=UPI003BEF4585